MSQKKAHKRLFRVSTFQSKNGSVSHFRNFCARQGLQIGRQIAFFVVSSGDRKKKQELNVLIPSADRPRGPIKGVSAVIPVRGRLRGANQHGLRLPQSGVNSQRSTVFI